MKTKVPVQVFLDVCVQLGLEVEQQKGWYKVHGPSGYRVYVRRTDLVQSVALSGFTVENGGVKDLGERSYGNVHQELDFGRPEADIVNSFKEVLSFMKGLAPVVKVRKERVRTTGEKRAVKFVGTELEAARFGRKELIERVAAEKGVAISPQAFRDDYGFPTAQADEA